LDGTPAVAEFPFWLLEVVFNEPLDPDPPEDGVEGAACEAGGGEAVGLLLGNDPELEFVLALNDRRNEVASLDASA
jgi:hypothetical protein